MVRPRRRPAASALLPDMSHVGILRPLLVGRSATPLLLAAAWRVRCAAARRPRLARGAAQWEVGGPCLCGAFRPLSGLVCAAATIRPDCHPVPVRGGLGDRHLRLFRRPRGRRPEAGAVDFARQDLERRDRRRASAGWSPGWSSALASGSAPASGGWRGRAAAVHRLAGRRPVRIVRSSGATASRIPATSSPVMAASWIASTGLSPRPSPYT